MLRVAKKGVVVIEPYNSMVGNFIGTEWEEHDGAINFVYRWDRKMMEQTVKSYLLKNYQKIRVFRIWDHNVVIGVRYAFNAPPPVAAPMAPAPTVAPAPAPARSYLVFFDWDKAELTERAKSIVKEAADNSTHVQVTRIEVNGYTDTSGKATYNQGLSVRRAQAVAGRSRT